MRPGRTRSERRCRPGRTGTNGSRARVSQKTRQDRRVGDETGGQDCGAAAARRRRGSGGGEAPPRVYPLPCGLCFGRPGQDFRKFDRKFACARSPQKFVKNLPARAQRAKNCPKSAWLRTGRRSRSHGERSTPRHTPPHTPHATYSTVLHIAHHWGLARPSAPAPFDLAAPLTPPPRPRVDPSDTENDDGDTSPRGKLVWSDGKGCWRRMTPRDPLIPRPE